VADVVAGRGASPCATIGHVSSDVEACEVCGFVWEDVPDDEIAARVLAGGEQIAGLLAGDPNVIATRPAPATWSPLEYAGHVRDVMLLVRDRLVIALVEDDATFKPLYREQRVDLGLYVGDEPDTVAAEVRCAASLFARAFSRIDPAALDRACEYGFPAPMRRTIRWMGQQVVHEVEHHLDDIAAGVRAQSPTT
jgi:DNA segregation ATPase FtsK/SpoIIIE, S-DNA-T family